MTNAPTLKNIFEWTLECRYLSEIGDLKNLKSSDFFIHCLIVKAGKQAESM